MLQRSVFSRVVSTLIFARGLTSGSYLNIIVKLFPIDRKQNIVFRVREKLSVLDVALIRGVYRPIRSYIGERPLLAEKFLVSVQAIPKLIYDDR